MLYADANRISAAQMDIWRGSAKRELFPAGVGFGSVANVKMLPITKSNYQLGNENWKMVLATLATLATFKNRRP